MIFAWILCNSSASANFGFLDTHTGGEGPWVVVRVLVFMNKNSCRGFGNDWRWHLRRHPSAWATHGGSLVACWWWDVLLPTFSNPSIFQSPNSNRVWILDFPNCPKFVQLPIFLSSNLLQWILENPKISPTCPKFSQSTQKSPNFQLRRRSPISKVQKLSNLKGTVTDRPIITI